MPVDPTPPTTFAEQQSFLRHWWGLGLVMALGLLLIPLLAQEPLPPLAWVAVLGLAGPLNFGLLALMKLRVRLDATGITYRFAPFAARHLAWTAVRRAYVRRYSALGEYGGWGIKGWSFDDYAYNVSGPHGLQLVLANGKRVLIGTQRPEELRQVLAALGVPGEAAA
jgi:hypothetical protein